MLFYSHHTLLLLYIVQCLVALVSSSPTAAVRTSSIWLAVTFLCGWGIFPLTFLTGA